MRGAWNGVARDVLLDSRAARARHHRSGRRRASARRRTPPAAPTAATRIWSLLNLELWYRTFIDGEGVQTLPVQAAPLPHDALQAR